MNKIVFISLFSLLIVISSCSKDPKLESKADFILKVNDTLTLNFSSNPTTGYSWHLVKKENTLLDSVNWVYKSSAGNLAGAGGNEIWTFKAKRTGIDTLTFEYKRIWEKENPPAEIKKFIIVIN